MSRARRFNTTPLGQELFKLTGLSLSSTACMMLEWDQFHTVEQFLAMDPVRNHIPNVGVKTIAIIHEMQRILTRPATPTNLTPLEAELWWIDQNLKRYDSPLHAESVKRNIEKRYRILELERELATS